VSDESYELVPHRYGILKGFAWPVCIECGHVFLKNYLSAWIDKTGCDHKWHPGYRKALVTEVRRWRQDKGIE
jgi:hypothetical protein